MAKIDVFVWKTDPGQVGNGIYSMVACFMAMGVHVPFTFEAHSENEYLQNVGNPVACDGSCKNRDGNLEDFGASRHDSSYDVTRIVERAFKASVP